ncbi:MAG: enoyl-CoA hydratase/isomerase family protein [Gemmatimonadales bacterium]|nr:enoyl-CoA hydratase/isomerase family protein [Gemmatimonadales bacterium]
MTVTDVPLRQSLDAGILTLTLDRPDKRNALSGALVESLHAGLERADLDAEVRVVVLRGAGRDFCAGADLEELLASAELTLAENEATALRLGALFTSMRRLPKPILAVVQGRALAGGAGLVTAADLAVAGMGAQLGYPEIQRGFVPAMVMTLLRRAVGEKIALDLVLTGRLLDAQHAQTAGLLARVVSDDDLDQESATLAEALASTSPSAMAFTKQLFHELDGRSLEEGLALGARVNAVARRTPEFHDAISRFLRR